MNQQQYNRLVAKRNRFRTNMFRCLRGRNARMRRRMHYWDRRIDCTYLCDVCRAPGSTECFLDAFLGQEIETQAPDEILCADHAFRAGYCHGCGSFYAGIDSFDFGYDGLCEGCRLEFMPPEYDDHEDFILEVPI